VIVLRDVIEARPVGGYRVYVRFDDGLAGEVDLAALITFEGVFAPLRAPDKFAELHVAPDLGTICWPNGADVAPETLYDAVLQGHPTTRAAS
jgi:hypothetical protein